MTCLIFPNSKNIGIGSFPQPAACRVVTRRTNGGGGGGGVRGREPSVHSSTPSVSTLHLIRWCLSPPTSNVGLNFSTTLHLQNSAMHMGQFEIFRNFYWAAQMGPKSNNPPPDLKFPFRDFAKPRFLFIYQCFSRDC